jgi:hypothetical protein
MKKEIEEMTRKELWAEKAEIENELVKRNKQPMFVRAQFSNALEARLKRVNNELDKCFWEYPNKEVCRQCWECREHYR